MKSLIKYIAYVFGGLLILDLIIRFVFSFTYSHVPKDAELRQRYKYELNEDPAEILIIGASRAMFCYKPSIIRDSLGMSVYDAGLDGVGVIGQYLSVKNALQNGRLKVVIFDLGDFQMSYKWNQDKISAYYPFYWVDKNVKELVDDCKPNAKWLLVSALYQYNSCFHDIIRTFIQKKVHDHGYEGLAYSGREWKPEYWKESNKAFDPDPWAEKYLDKIVELCKENQVKLIFTMSPGLGSGFKSTAIYLENYCKKHHLPFWNYTDLKELHHDSKYFKDYNHINEEGVKIFVPIFAHQLKEYLRE